MEIAESTVGSCRLAELYGVAKTTIQRIRNGTLWGQVTGLPKASRQRLQVSRGVEITQQVLMQFLHYDPATGIFTKLDTRRTIGGRVDKGYIQIKLGGKAYCAHRLAWLYMTGAWPPALIDHKNGNKSDNSFDNLREADFSQNVFNSRKKEKLSGLPRGVRRTSSPSIFRSEIYHRRIRYDLGCFRCPEEAGEAYRSAAERLHGEFAAHLGVCAPKDPIK